VSASTRSVARRLDLVQRWPRSQDFDPIGGPASRLAELQRRERPIDAKVIRDAGVKVE